MDPTFDTKNFQKKIQRFLVDMNVLLSEKQTVSEQGDLKPKMVRISRCGHRMAHKVRMRKLFNLYNDWLLQRGLPDSGGLLKSAYLIAFSEDDLNFIYGYQRHLQEVT